jgi:hypothetical protein
MDVVLMHLSQIGYLRKISQNFHFLFSICFCPEDAREFSMGLLMTFPCGNVKKIFGNLSMEFSKGKIG